MKVLFLVQKEQRAILDRLYDGIAAHCECDTRWLSSEEQADLRGYFRKHVDVSRYDRILFFLRFKKEMRQVRFIRSVPNLVILEHDAYQNYIPCKYTGKFSAHYRRLPWARVISSGHTVSERLRQEGFDAVFVPKGYDQTLLHDLGLARDIELGFVGSTGSVAYSGRKALLDELGGVENLLVTKTKSGEEYLRTLNRIRFFVSADVGMGEYMIKNFEAMACGCVLLALRPGRAGKRGLGFPGHGEYRAVSLGGGHPGKARDPAPRYGSRRADRAKRPGAGHRTIQLRRCRSEYRRGHAARVARAGASRMAGEDLATYFYLRVAAEKSWGFRRVCYCSACFSGLGGGVGPMKIAGSLMHVWRFEWGREGQVRL